MSITPFEFAYDVFISYSQHDQAWVRNVLVPRLENAGLKVCIDYRDFRVGVPIVKEIERALVTSRHTLLVLTPAYLESAWTDFEALMVSTLDPGSQKARLLPLLLEPCEPPIRIRYIIAADFTMTDEVELAWWRLLDALGVPEPRVPRPEPPSRDPGRRSRESGCAGWRGYIFAGVFALAFLVAALCYLFPPPATVALLTHHRKYAAVTDTYATWTLKGIAERPDEMSRLTLLCLKDGKAAFQFDDRFVSARNNEGDRDWELRAEVTELQAWEEFELFDPDTGAPLPCRQVLRRLYLGQVRLALWTSHDHWVSAMWEDKDWVLRGETTRLDAYEKFVVIKAPRRNW